MDRKRVSQLCLFAGIIIMCLPLVLFTLYTYPVQDDFFYTWKVWTTMEEGHTAFGAVLLCTLRSWKDFSGYFFSMFLCHLSDALVQCDIWGIRLWQFVQALLFYATVFLFIRTMVVKVFRYEKEKALPVIFLFFICLTSLYYFEEHEDFLWFCASVIYLIPMMFILTGCVCMVYALESGRKRYMLLAMMLGFPGGGGVLNIAAFGCMLYVMTAYWGIVVRRQIKKSVVMSLPMLIGGVINVIAPGNFARKGGLASGEIWKTVPGTIQYVCGRVKMFLFQYPLSTVVFIALLIFLLCIPLGVQKYKFYAPFLFTLVMFLEVCVVIYPTALGYGMDVYQQMDRSNFISDFVIFFNFFLTIFYWRGWLAVKFQDAYVKEKYRLAAALGILLLFACALGWSLKWNKISSLRLCRELCNGEAASYARWNVSVIEAMEKECEEAGGKNIIEISTSPAKDSTCLENPKFLYGYYDPEETFGNGSYARFYGVDAIYIYEKP